MMKTLEDKIVSFNNWSQPWTFHQFVSGDTTLPEAELNTFSEIWAKAGDFALWNHEDLVLGCQESQKFIATHYKLSDQAIANIVRALSYEWK